MDHEQLLDNLACNPAFEERLNEFCPGWAEKFGDGNKLAAMQAVWPAVQAAFYMIPADAIARMTKGAAEVPLWLLMKIDENEELMPVAVSEQQEPLIAVMDRDLQALRDIVPGYEAIVERDPDGTVHWHEDGTFALEFARLVQVPVLS